jgi:hypothetical protein
MAEELTQLKEQVYRDPRPKEAFDAYHERTRTRKPNFVYEIVRICTTCWPGRSSARGRTTLSACRPSAR